ncbi:MAG TPA: hypothetical protein VFU19_08045, partial [Iamia sp.]|nr:hypothetical protein [Iamia sp.]
MRRDRSRSPGMGRHPGDAEPRSTALFGRRVMLRPLALADFPAWREVRVRCHDWLTVWEPSRQAGAPDPTTDRDAFGVRCAARQRER